MSRGLNRKVSAELVRVLRAARLEAGLTQEALADRMAVSCHALRAWEGEYRSPAFPMLERWAAALGHEVRIVRKPEISHV